MANLTSTERKLRLLLERIAPIAGDRLPSERALAECLGCSRETLRKSLVVLEREGELWRHVGQGTFRGKRPHHLPIRDTLVIEGATPPDVMRARLLLEPQIAAEAARKASADHVAMLTSKVNVGRKGRDRQECEAADTAFHNAIAEVSGNPLLIQMFAFLSGTRRRIAWQREWDRTYRRVGVDEFRTVHSDQHARVIAAISRGDADEAATAIKVHLKTIETTMQANSAE
jgi:DNA-binding FadR family transcriptional regulator